MRCRQHSQNLASFAQGSPELRVLLCPEGEGLGSRMFTSPNVPPLDTWAEKGNVKFLRRVVLVIILEANVYLSI